MESAGLRLKKIRLEKGISLEDISKKTKIHLNILKAIEEDSPVNLSPIYAKGFLKIYCKFLSINPADYICGYKEPQKAAIVEQGVKGKEHLPSFFKSASVKLKTFKPNKKTKLAATAVLVIIVSLMAIFHLGRFIASRRYIVKRENKMPVFSAQDTRQKKAQAPEPQKSQKPSSKQKSSVSTLIRLGILAKEDCWVTLKADGRIIFHGNLKKGKSESWQAKEKMELSLSNAGAVDLIVNGERISPVGKKGQALKNIVITKEGLSVS